ncbi:MAG: glycosyltransferase family 39 protein [Candidatus Bathyarchaeum sp.]|nr:MAG: glycosyltransferase family 39 protein [Candidatus Bathyarchaeum sp.]
MKISKLFSREKVVNALTSGGALRFRITHSSLLHISLLILILVIAAVIRLLPIRWGYQLSEFDPHVHYRLTKNMVDNGFFAWTSWTDTMAWYPQGINFGRNLYPGLAATAAFFYQIADALNLAPAPILNANVYHPLTADPVFNFVIIFPVIMAVLTVLVIYFVGKDIGGKEVGLFSAFFLALNSPYIGRTSLGFFDDETVGIFGILLFIFFFLRSIDPERPLRNSVVYGVAGGLSLGYLFSSWGAARYAIGISMIFVLVLILLRRYSSRLLLSYSATFGVALFIAANIPKLGFQFLTEPTILAVAGMFILLGIYEISRYIKTSRNKAFFVFAFLALIVVLYIGLSNLGVIGSLESKFLSAINPSTRIGESTSQQLVQSVQEHRPATWGSLYFDVGIGVLFIPVGLFFAVQNPTNRNIFLTIFGLTAIYFAGSMVRLTLLLAPAVSLLWALALVQVVRPFITILREGPKIARRKMRFRPRVGKEFSAAFIILMFLLLTVTFVLPSFEADYPRVVSRAYSPTTIASSSLPIRPNEPVRDWLDALNWMRVNLEPTDVVASWWDYGYWITNIANKTTLADNGTVNSTQISLIGQMFMSNETEAIKFLKKYDVTHVVVYHSFRQDPQTGEVSDAIYGDEGKWRWMAKIGGLDDNDFGNTTITQGGLGTSWVDAGDYNGQEDQGEQVPDEEGMSTVLYKLMHYGREMVLYGSSEIELEHFAGPPEGYFSQKVQNIGWFPDGQGYYAIIVCVYKVNYD